jgi:NAD+ kinase
LKTLLVNNKKYRQSTQYMTEEIIEKLQSRGIEVLVDDGSQTISDQELDNIIVLGGDGTMLRAARTYGQGDLPILGINMGTVGFLSNIEINEVDGYLDQFLQGDYTIDTMMMLEVNIYEQGVLASTSYCLNEVVIKARIPNMITLNYRINEQPCVPYKGDGLIFATPAGSTAYSLSAGGPIVDPELEAIIITPVAPYTFSAFGQKPAVIAASKVIRVTPPRFREALISLDGHVTMDFSYNNSIEIKKAHRGLKLANVKKVPFFSTINKRLKRSAGK